MNPKFAFSFDRETYQGEFATRQAALDAAMVALRNRSDMPEGIFVGRWVETSLQTSDHADNIISDMRDRWQSANNDNHFLERVNEQQAADLDYELDRVIRTWLTKHNLLPTQNDVQAVSEYPVPNVRNVADQSAARDMVSISDNCDTTPQR